MSEQGTLADADNLLSNPLFTAAAPEVSAEFVEQVVRETFGLDVKATRLHSERDANFLVKSQAAAFILKITNKEEPSGVTDFQTQALLHLERTMPNLPVPHLIRTLAGEPATRIELNDGTSAVRLLGYLDGAPLRELERAQFPLTEIGRMIAVLDTALASFDHPNKTYDLLWDSSALMRLKPLVRFVSHPALARTCQEVLYRFEASVQPRLGTLDWQVIHNDVNLNNILVSQDGRVSGVFDFGDMIYAPRINELAVTCSYHVVDEASFAQALTTLMSAYNDIFPLTENELDILYDLILARFVTTILITYWRASMFPHNQTYILRNNPVSVEGLRILSAAGPDAARRIFRAACHLE